MPTLARLVKSEYSFYNVGMPRVSQEHLDARRRQILDAARHCFVRNGFHATSMQDILTEANLSAGAVYRYFRSKDDIIAAIAVDALAEVTGAFEDVFDTDTPLPPVEEALGRILATIQRLDDTQDLAKVAIQVWGEALRSPSLAERFTEAISSVRLTLTSLIEAYQERGLITREVPADQVAPVVVGLVHGLMVQHALLGDVDAATFGDGLGALLAINRPNTASYSQDPSRGFDTGNV